MKRNFLCFLVLALIFFPHLQAQEVLCGDGIDNDGDGLIDCYDTDCGGTSACASFYYGVPIPDCRYIPAAYASNFDLELVWQSDNSSYNIDQRHSPLVGDIDGDGTPEVVSKTNGNTAYIRVFDGITGALEVNITVSNGIYAYSNFAIGDVDGDGTGEIFVITRAPRIERYEHTGGTASWVSSDTVASREASLGLANFDGDATVEVYSGTKIFNATSGTLVANGVDGIGGGSAGAKEVDEPYSVAIDVFTSTDVIPGTGSACGSLCDGLEIVAGDTVYAVDLSQGAIADRITAVSWVSGLGDGVTSVADMDNDGDLDGVICYAGEIYVWDLHSGTQLYTTYDIPSTGSGGRINIADFDNDGYMEMGVAGNDIYVVVDTNSSSELVTKWSVTGLQDGSQRTGSTVFDFEGDGQNEVIYSDENSLFVFNGATGDTIVLESSPSGTRYDYPIVADVDGNGQAEIVITSQDVAGPSNSGTGYIRVYKSKNLPWVPAREVWNQHAFIGTNINDDLTIPSTQQNHHIVPELNGFLVQSTIRLEDGDPAFVAPNVQPQILSVSDAKCGNDTLLVTVRIGNTGDGKFPAGGPVAFYLGNPHVAGSTFLDTTITSVTVNPGTYQDMTFNVQFTSGDFPAELFVILNDSGFQNASLPLDLSDNFPVTGVGECDYTNNMTSVYINASCGISLDKDEDGIADGTDLDADNDGIPDAEEDGNTGFDPTADADGDGIVNYLDNSDGTVGFPAWADVNGDGVNDVYDQDNDGIPDALDLDADNDGIPDLIEAGGKDSDGDGRVDCFSTSIDPTSLTDTDTDGWCDIYDNTGGAFTSGTPLSYPDTDGDGLDDYLDIDADNDGVPDVIEAGGLDTDGDGYPDNLFDEDRDGLADIYDPDDDGVFGADGSETGDPLVTTSGDNGDGTPTGYASADADRDGVPNYIDLDSDNDGISDLVESGGTDSGNDGIVDAATDTDGDGFADTFDADNSGIAIIVTGSDTDADNRPNGYLADDTDGDGIASFVDIDADNDGILDNMEAQSTAGYTVPVNTDTDNDGILNAYEGGFLDPVNTDSGGAADYLDTDSDDDGIDDEDEAWDAYDDGDSVNDLTCSSDTDQDGLLDCYDADDNDATVRTVGATPPNDNGYDGTAYTASQTSTGSTGETIFPNNGGAAGEPDWRDNLSCGLAPSLTYPITGTGYIYNSGTNKHTASAATTGSIRASDFCDGFIDAGYKYYFNPMNPDQIIFSVAHGSNTTRIDYVELRRGDMASRKVTSGSQGHFVMPRDWFVKTVDNAPLTANVNVRFYYPASDSVILQDSADAFVAEEGGAKGGVSWFKVDDQWQLINISAGDGLSAETGYTVLTPAGYGTEGGLHYVQFDNISSFSGGGAILEVDGVLPVELTSFGANLVLQNVQLTWETAIEINSRAFHVERSLDGKDFEQIHTKAAAGTSQTRNSYAYLDTLVANLGGNTLYYRLRMEDQDGTFRYSKIAYISVQQDKELEVSLYPNPTSDFLKINFSFKHASTVKIKITDVSGREVYENGKTFNSGAHEHKINVDKWAPGVYFMQIEGSGQRIIRKLIIE